MNFGGWQRRQPEPDTIFTSPHGDIQRTNDSGTFDLGHGSSAHLPADLNR